MEEKKKVHIDKQEQAEEDEATIFAETAHIRNRDEIVMDGNRIVQGGSSTDIDDEWDPSDEERLNGISDMSSDAVDAQLSTVERISEPIRNSRDHHRPTLAKPAAKGDNYESLSDEELMKYADVLGIPDRQKVPRMKLIGLIREQERRGL